MVVVIGHLGYEIVRVLGDGSRLGASIEYVEQESTLGLAPAVCQRDRGVYFRFAGRRLPDFACRWPQTEMVGGLPVWVATGAGSWTPNSASASRTRRKFT